MSQESATAWVRPREVRIGPIFQRMRDAAIVADLDTGMIRLWNPAAERLFGYTTSEALALRVEALVPERLRPQHSAGFITYRETGHGALIDRGTPIEVSALRKTGEEITVELTLSPIEDPHIEGRCVLGIIRDVSERTKAEEALRDSEERFHTLADNIPQLAWMADPKGWIFWYSRRWYEYTGTTFEEVQGWGWTKVHHPDHVQRVVARIQRSWETGEPWEDTFPLRASDGRYRWFLSRALPIRNASGDIVRWFGTNTDITQQREAEQERERLLASERAARRQAEAAGRRLEVQYDLAELLAEALTPEQVADVILRKGVPALRAQSGAVYLNLDGAELNVVGTSGLPEDIVTSRRTIALAGSTPLAEAVRRGTPIWVYSAEEVGRNYPDLFATYTSIGHAVWACIPLQVGRQTTGALALTFAEAREFGEDDHALLLALARQCALALERTRLYAAERHARLLAEETSAQLGAIQTVTETALAHLFLKDLLHELLARISATLGVDTAAVFFSDATGKYLESRAARGLGEASERSIRIPVGAGFTGRLAVERRAIAVEDINAADVLDPRLRERKVRSVLGAPLVVEGRVIGVVHVGTVRRHRFTENEMHLLQLVADRMALVIEHVRLYEAEQRARGEAETLAAERDAILRQIADGVVIADPSGTVVFANDVAKRLLGLPEPGTLLAGHTGRYPVLTRGGDPFAPGELPLARAARMGDVMVDTELRVRHPDGTERVVLESAVPVVGEDGTRHGAVLAVHDVTAQRELERQKEEFFANVSHDLRTPVTTIKASIDVVLENEPPGTPEPLHRLLTNINREAERMTTLVNDLLELTRLQTGRVHLDLAPHDLRTVAEHVASAIEPLANRRGQRVELVLPKRAIVVKADARHLERALLNVLDNASRYGREGGVIQLRLHRKTKEAVFSVEDDGPGIPEADQARIFERFYRPENEATRRDQGSGLGLPIARAMAELHGGRIWVESVPGHGATFRIALPVVPPAMTRRRKGRR